MGFKEPPTDHLINDSVTVTMFYLRFYAGPLILFVAALTSSLVGYGLLRAAGTSTKQVIPPQDYQLLSQMLAQNNQDGINNYIKLSGLTGIIGAFTKVGLTGLPLATIGLTVFFAVLGVILRDNTNHSTSLIDLAKLTLGAFIGSYVQRQSSDVQRQSLDAQTQMANAQKHIADIQAQLVADQNQPVTTVKGGTTAGEFRTRGNTKSKSES